MTNAQGLVRKWTTLLNADVVGYSAMMSRNELGTLYALLTNMRWLSRSVKAFGGRVIDSPGDNLLAEFGNEAAAVECALFVQQRVEERNSGIVPELQIRFRIGVHSGTLIELRQRLYGEAVNVSARLQSVADCGGVLVSSATAERLPCEMSEAMLRNPRSFQLKHIPLPVTALEARVSP